MQLRQSPGPETRLEDTCSQPGSPRRSAGDPARPFPLCPPGPLGDCDPAKIAYTGKIPAMALEAVEDWVKACCGADWYECNLDLGYGTPFVHLSCDFQSPITPRYELLFQLVVESLGSSSVAIRLEGAQGGKTCLRGRYVFTFVEAGSFAPIPIPPAIRLRMAGFADRQGSPWENKDRTS